MHESILFAIAAVLVLGVGAQWLSWWLRIPSILLLLVLGFIAGPILHVLEPDEQFGEILLPMISLGVALILYEGGLSLQIRELKGSGRVVWRLVSIGAAVTWIIGAGAARLVQGLPLDLAILLGAILVVTGPTVIIPMLQHLRLVGRIGSVLKWEGIVIDPIGAMLAVIVFEVILAGSPESATRHVTLVTLQAVAIGGALGVAAGLVLALLIRAYAIPDFLENAVSVMFVVAVYAAAEFVQSESGLLATVVMGVTLANQRLADVRHIVEFKENLRVLLISSLFILLAARIELATFEQIGWRSLLLLAVLIVVGRPLSVLCSTIGSALDWRERLLLAWMAPRGIVAAAVAAVFALRLQEVGYEQAPALVPLAFMVIVGTVILYGLTAPALARRLGLSDPSPQGVLLIGAHHWARVVADGLKSHGVRVQLADTNRGNLAAARMANLPVYRGSILARQALEAIDLGGIGKLLAVTPNDWVNVLAVQRFSRIFGRSEVYQIPSGAGGQREQEEHRHLHGRWLFGDAVTYADLAARVARGAVMKATPITDAFTFESYREMYGERAVPMFIISEAKNVTVLTAGATPEPTPGQTLLSLVEEPPAAKRAEP